MKKYVWTIATITLLLTGITGCQRNAITGRKQLSLVPESEAQSLAASQYKSFIQTNQLVTGTADALMVKRVGEKIVNAIKNYYQQNSYYCN